MSPRDSKPGKLSLEMLGLLWRAIGAGDAFAIAALFAARTGCLALRLDAEPKPPSPANPTRRSRITEISRPGRGLNQTQRRTGMRSIPN